MKYYIFLKNKPILGVFFTARISNHIIYHTTFCYYFSSLCHSPKILTTVQKYKSEFGVDIFASPSARPRGLLMLLTRRAGCDSLASHLRRCCSLRTIRGVFDKEYHFPCSDPITKLAWYHFSIWRPAVGFAPHFFLAPPPKKKSLAMATQITQIWIKRVTPANLNTYSAKWCNLHQWQFLINELPHKNFKALSLLMMC